MIFTHLDYPYFNAVFNKTCCLKVDKLISEDTTETASYLNVKVVYKHNMTRLKSPPSKGEARGIRLRIGRGCESLRESLVKNSNDT